VGSGGPVWGPNDAGLATYVNGVEILASQWDFTFLFSQVSATPRQLKPGEEVGVQVTKNLVGRFVMSPQHAKAFVEILRQNVQTYEDQHGEIPLLGTTLEQLAPQVIDAPQPEPTVDLPTEPPTSPEEPSHGD
jgi:hypothetical protein